MDTYVDSVSSILALVNVFINIVVHIYFQHTDFIFFGHLPKTKSPKLFEVLFLIFGSSAILLSKIAVLNYIVTKGTKVPFPHFLTVT